MASLYDTLGQTTVDTSTDVRKKSKAKPTLTELTDTQGMPSAAAITPASAAMVGGDKEQAKMAGTPGQVAKALQQPIAHAEKYATAVRTERARTVATPAEEALKEEAKKWKELGTLGTGVQAAMNAALTAAATTAAAAPATLDESMLEGYTEEEKGTIKTDFAAWQNAPEGEEKMRAWDKLATSVGAGSTDAEAAEKLQTLLPTSTDAVAQMVSAATPDNINVEAILKADPNLQELLDNAGVKYDPTMTVAQLQSIITSMTGQQFGRIGELQGRLANPNLSAADRKEARKALNDAGAIGIRATEEEIRDLEDQINEADDVRLADGTTVPMADLLKDDKVEELVTSFIDGTNPEALDTLPGLKALVQNNQELFKSVIVQAQGDEKTFDTMQTTWKASMEPVPGHSLNEDVMTSLFGADYKKVYSQTALDDRVNNPLVKMAFDLNAAGDSESYDAFVKGINALADAGIDIKSTFAGMDAEDIKALGITEPGSTKWANTSSWLLLKQNASGDDVAEALAPLGGLGDYVQSLQRAHDIGTRKGGKYDTAKEALFDLLDTGGPGGKPNGKLDAGEITPQAMASAFATMPLSTLLSLNVAPRGSAATSVGPFGLREVNDAAIVRNIDRLPIDQRGISKADIISAYGSSPAVEAAWSRYEGRKKNAAEAEKALAQQAADEAATNASIAVQQKEAQKAEDKHRGKVATAATQMKSWARTHDINTSTRTGWSAARQYLKQQGLTSSEIIGILGKEPGR